MTTPAKKKKWLRLENLEEFNFSIGHTIQFQRPLPDRVPRRAPDEHPGFHLPAKYGGGALRVVELGTERPTGRDLYGYNIYAEDNGGSIATITETGPGSEGQPYIAVLSHDWDAYQNYYHWERRYLRQNALHVPLSLKLSFGDVKVKRPIRKEVHDHALPGLFHLDRLLSLSARDYEPQSPLLQQENGTAFRPSQADLRIILAAERANHKLVHEKSADTEAQIDYSYAQATLELPAKTDANYADAKGVRDVSRAYFLGFDTPAYFAAAPAKAPRYAVLSPPTTPPPATET